MACIDLSPADFMTALVGQVPVTAAITLVKS
jgi:hypothetical protein